MTLIEELRADLADMRRIARGTPETPTVGELESWRVEPAHKPNDFDPCESGFRPTRLEPDRGRGSTKG